MMRFIFSASTAATYIRDMKAITNRVNVQHNVMTWTRDGHDHEQIERNKDISERAPGPHARQDASISLCLSVGGDKTTVRLDLERQPASSPCLLTVPCLVGVGVGLPSRSSPRIVELTLPIGLTLLPTKPLRFRPVRPRPSQFNLSCLLSSSILAWASSPD